MTAERWARMKEIFGEALDLPEQERPAFLDQHCGSDSVLRREIEKLLEAEAGPLESPVSGLLPPAPPEISRGEMLDHYRVESKVGHGGMGVVYRAVDTRLQRPVALKVLAPGQFGSPNRRQRLVREAQAASGLAHPNIVTVYDIGFERGIEFIAMEYIEGRPLDKLIPESGLPARQVLAYAVQIASALVAAHAAGIVHRDLKPANVMITRDGLVKLLDFGLASGSRLIERDGLTLTLEGEIVGTPSYMSPEQVRGVPVDHRSDIFSFGALLFRMVTGRDAFEGPTAIEIMNAILNADPAAAFEGSSGVPFAMESIIRHCLEKSPEDRFQSARDLGYALEASGGPSSSSYPAVLAPKPSRSTMPWIIGSGIVAVVAVLIGLLALRMNRPPASVNGRTFAQITDEAGAELFPSLSGDGKQLAYAGKASGNWDIYLQRIGGGESENLTRDSKDDDTQPAFSPDGKQIAFRSDRNGGGIFVMNRNGSGVRRVVDSGYNPEWSPDSKQLVYAEESIMRPEDRTGRLSHIWSVDVASGRKRMLTKSDGVQPQWSPNGRNIAYWAIDLDGDRDIWTMPADGGQPIRITRDSYIDWNPVWSPDARHLYFCSNRGGSMGIWRIPMKEGSGEPRGSPEPIRTPTPYPAHLSFSHDGRQMSYSALVTTGRISTVRFNLARETVVSEPKEIMRSERGASRPALSPGGDALAFNSTEQDESLFVMGTDGTGLRQLTSGKYKNRGPRWSPDGKHLAFFSTLSGEWEIWTMNVSSGEMRQVTQLTGQNVAWPAWSNDGRRLAYTVFGSNTFLLDMTRPWEAQTPEKLPPFPDHGQIFNGWSWSPDGRYLAGFLNRGDGIALYTIASRSFRKITSYGADPVWLNDSRRLLFHNKGQLHLVDTESGAAHEVLSIAPEEIDRRGFAVSPDDTHIYFAVSTTEADVWMIDFAR